MSNSIVNQGTLSFKKPFILAPLAGYTNLAFRILCREYGAALCYSEMISCHGLVHKQKNTLMMTATDQCERPVVMQLFGSEPVMMGKAAAILSEKKIDAIDINMGCPVRKVVKKGGGAALMKDPELARDIISQVCAHTHLPVSVKIRSGWNHEHINGVEFARMAQDAGASFIAVHARTWSDGFSGQVNWDIIRQVKEAVHIPVIGNGDILTYRQGLDMMAETKCDGVMIGRAALGAPWIFSSRPTDSISAGLRVKTLSRYLELLEKYANGGKNIAAVKNQAGRFFKGLANGSYFKKRIYQTESFDELKNLVHSFLDGNRL